MRERDAEGDDQFESADDGWILASIPEVPGTLSQGRAPEEARART
jgi:predicted RNase H-like HicB family nuclease